MGVVADQAGRLLLLKCASFSFECFTFNAYLLEPIASGHRAVPF
jgi:hypothetical protein